MKVAQLLPLLGAASAAVAPAQIPLGGFALPASSLPSPKSKPWLHPLDELKKHLGSLSEEARKTWDEIALMFPESFDASNFNIIDLKYYYSQQRIVYVGSPLFACSISNTSLSAQATVTYVTSKIMKTILSHLSYF